MKHRNNRRVQVSKVIGLSLAFALPLLLTGCDHSYSVVKDFGVEAGAYRDTWQIVTSDYSKRNGNVLESYVLYIMDIENLRGAVLTPTQTVDVLGHAYVNAGFAGTTTLADLECKSMRPTDTCAAEWNYPVKTDDATSKCATNGSAYHSSPVTGVVMGYRYTFCPGHYDTVPG